MVRREEESTITASHLKERRERRLIDSDERRGDETDASSATHVHSTSPIGSPSPRPAFPSFSFPIVPIRSVPSSSPFLPISPFARTARPRIPPCGLTPRRDLPSVHDVGFRAVPVFSFVHCSPFFGQIAGPSHPCLAPLSLASSFVCPGVFKFMCSRMARSSSTPRSVCIKSESEHLSRYARCELVPLASCATEARTRSSRQAKISLIAFISSHLGFPPRSALYSHPRNLLSLLH